MLKSLRKVCGLSKAFPGGIGSKEPANTGDIRDVGSILGSGISPGEGNGNPLQYSCLENHMDGGTCWDAVCRVPKSWTLLKQLSTYACLGIK